jgi:hypothetical protein
MKDVSKVSLVRMELFPHCTSFLICYHASKNILIKGHSYVLFHLK